MCCLTRHSRDGEWSIMALGKPSGGDVSDYSKMTTTIGDLFSEGLFKYVFVSLVIPFICLV
jgi:hypothetical protein